MPNFDWGKFISTAAKDAAKTAAETSGPAPGTGSVPSASSSVVSKTTPVDVGSEPPLVDIDPASLVRRTRRTSFFDRHGFGGM